MEKLLGLSLQVKLTLIFFVFALIPLSAVGFLAIKSAEETVFTMATNQMEQIAEDKASLLEKWIAERKADVQVVAHSSILKSLDSRQIAPYLEVVRSRYGEYGDISVVSVDGRWIHGSLGAAENIVSKEWFTEAASGKLYMSDIFFDEEKGESFFLIAAPLWGPSQRVKGVVCAKVGTGTLLSVILQVSLGETGECYLVNLEGTFLVHKERERILAENIAQSDSFRNILHNPGKRIIYTDYRGVEVLGASKRVKGTHWALVAEQDRDEAFQEADALRQYVLAAIVLSTLGAFVAAWLLSRYVVLPIRSLGNAAHQLASGDFENVTLEKDRTDEMGLLYKAFAEMARQLQDRQAHLEKTVIRREEELKETDVMLKQTQEAAERSQQLASLGQLAAGVAHEIRTPLASLKMFLESMESERDIPSEYGEDFLVAMTQLQRMEDTINRFLNLAKPQEPIMGEVHVEELIEDALLMAGPKARQQETRITLRVPRNLPPLRGDRKLLGEALLNLMANALEAMGRGGKITVEASLEKRKTEQGTSHWVRLNIKDTGPGITEENLQRIFDPFFTTRVNGTGLGLSIVRSTMQGHGGTIEAASHGGRGSTFSLFMPVEKIHAEESEPH